MNDKLTRKEFFDATARTAVGVSVGFFGGTLLTAAGAAQEARQEPITVKAIQDYKWPWPYTPLDPEDIRKRGHKFYYDGGCGYGAFNALVSALGEKFGEPYTLMPPQMLSFGGGGGAGWGTLCGALNGAAAAISLVVDRSSASSIVSELFGWSSMRCSPATSATTTLPSTCSWSIATTRRSCRPRAARRCATGRSASSIRSQAQVVGARARRTLRAVDRRHRRAGRRNAQRLCGGLVQGLVRRQPGRVGVHDLPRRNLRSCHLDGEDGLPPVSQRHVGSLVLVDRTNDL